uniref:ATP-dependent DNA helicase n=1 Tax=Tanacetum cinerariifolium TaxID=118510 RepID=A0A6L2KUE8_TANCI|nr:hypothetical protein CTI12_AA123990 [Tanacetum cinerariifolium]
MFCFTSFGARIDHSVNSGRGPYTFRINGQNYHRIGSLLPAKSDPLRYAQLYFFDTQNEIRNRMSAFMSKETPETVDENIKANQIQMLDQTSVMAKSFRMAKEWCRSHGDANFGLGLLSERTTIRQYNTPTISEVSTLIINDFGDCLPIRDIVVNKNNTGPQRILELHPSYMALQYPLLFPFGEYGYHENIPYHTNKGIRKTKRGNVTMKEYYAYIIQQQQNQGTTLLRGGRLFQQYLVDAFTAIEEQRLNWTRNNQDMLRVDLYHNLCDVVKRRDTSATGLGKRIVLPRTYVGSPRYMMHNYQDAMALCRTYGPDRATISIQENVKADINGASDQIMVVDEIKNYLNCRFLYPCEAVWCLFSFDINYAYPTVMQLNYHLPDQKAITLRDSEHLPALIEREGISITIGKFLGDGAITARLVCYNIVVIEAPSFDANKSKVEHEKLHSMLNPEQRLIYEQIIESVHNDRGQFCFIYGPGGTGKTFLYQTIIARLRSEQMIVLFVSSSGITAHCRFVIPLELMENNTCGIKQGTHLAELLQHVRLIIWDEASMTQRYAFEALDKTL